MLIKNENHSNSKRNHNTEVKVQGLAHRLGPVQTCLSSRDLDQPAGRLSVPPGWRGGAQHSHRDGGAVSQQDWGGLTDSLQDGGCSSLPQG